jgi:predicted dehydrogenase
MIRVAVAGFGYWGPNLVRNFNQNPDSQLVACCDLSPERRAAIGDAYPDVRLTDQYSDLLNAKDIDAIVVATPARTHFEMAKQALLHGKHVLVEKPLAMNSREAEQLVELANSKSLTLMVGHTFLYSPAVCSLKKAIQDGVLGDIYYLQTQRRNFGRVQTDINAMWSLAPHDVSIVLELLGQVPSEVSANGRSFLTPGVQDVVYMTLTFPTGQIANIHISWLDPAKVRQVTVVGSRRMADYDDVAPTDKVTIVDKQAVPPASGKGPFELRKGTSYTLDIPGDEPLAKEVGDFVSSIKTGDKPKADGNNGLLVVQILEAAQQSMDADGKPMPLVTNLALQPV